MLQVFRAPPGLSHWIAGAVVMRLAPGCGVSRFPALPHAMLTMRFQRPAGQAEAAMVLCPPVSFHTISTGPAAYPHAGDVTALGLLVRPGAAACLLGAASGVIVDQVLDWCLIAGASEAMRLEQEADRACTDMARLRVLINSFKRTMAAASRGRDIAYARLCAAVGSHGALAGEHLGMGRRQLERHCQAVLGLAPKQFQRLVRLHAALSMAVAAASRPLADVALEAGFYDQSHFARDTRQLVGVPVRSLIAQARPDSPWWPLATGRMQVQPGAAPAWDAADRQCAELLLPRRHHR